RRGHRLGAFDDRTPAGRSRAPRAAVPHGAGGFRRLRGSPAPGGHPERGGAPRTLLPDHGTLVASRLELLRRVRDVPVRGHLPGNHGTRGRGNGQRSRRAGGGRARQAARGAGMATDRESKRVANHEGAKGAKNFYLFFLSSMRAMWRRWTSSGPSRIRIVRAVAAR